VIAIFVDQGIGRALMALHVRVMTGELVGRVNCALGTKADVVIFGNSRAVHHLDPGVIEPIIHRSVFNAGVDGCHMEYARLLSRLMLQRGSMAKVFVLEIDHYILSEFDLDRARRLLPFMDELPLIAMEIRQARPLAGIKLLSRSYRFEGLATSLVLHNFFPGPAIGGGFSPLMGRLKKSDLTPRPIFRTQMEPRAERYLRDFIREAQSKGIEVVLVTGPYYPPRPNRPDPLMEELISLSRKEGVVLLRIDEQVYPELREVFLFKDEDHLNHGGAVLYSKLVGRALVSRLGMD